MGQQARMVLKAEVILLPYLDHYVIKNMRPFFRVTLEMSGRSDGIFQCESFFIQYLCMTIPTSNMHHSSRGNFCTFRVEILKSLQTQAL